MSESVTNVPHENTVNRFRRFLISCILISIKFSNDVLTGNDKTKNFEVAINLMATERDILLCKVAVVCVKFSGNSELVVSIA